SDQFRGSSAQLCLGEQTIEEPLWQLLAGSTAAAYFQPLQKSMFDLANLWIGHSTRLLLGSWCGYRRGTLRQKSPRFKEGQRDVDLKPRPSQRRCVRNDRDEVAIRISGRAS